MKNTYTTLHYLAAALKEYGIEHIVASPGIQNSCFNLLVQETSYFQCHSVIDERSAAYYATGLIRELDKPVVITCTGATSSRNYLPAMTEAYYSKLPVIAVTFFNPISTPYNLEPQFLDRRVSQNDVKSLSIELPIIHSQEDVDKCLGLLNTVLNFAVYKKEPVHINCPANTDFAIEVNSLPKVWKTDYYNENFEHLKNEISNNNFGIFVGAHDRFSDEETNAISEFAQSWDIPVICDHTSHYKGENKILLSKIFQLFDFGNQKFDTIIDIGGITGNYFFKKLFKKNITVWRVSEDPILKIRNNSIVTKFFNCKEKFFFNSLKNSSEIISGVYSNIKKTLDTWKVPELPLSNPFICHHLASCIPNNSVLHCSIIHSLRCMDFFDLDNSIDVYCNVGGFGIDGALSTMVGQSCAMRDRKYYGLVGDTAFFYDMNILGNREISKNLRIILVNNGKGMEFRLGGTLEKNWGDKIDILIASAGHNKGGARGWVEACGFEYMSARTKEEFINQIDSFCNGEFDKPILFEVFTTTKDEQFGFDLMINHNRNKLGEAAIKIYKTFKG